jgi:hypothetical protein
MSEHTHFWAAAFMGLGFLGSRCRCGERRFLAGYRDERRNRIVERLNTTWRVR